MKNKYYFEVSVIESRKSYIGKLMFPDDDENPYVLLVHTIKKMKGDKVRIYYSVEDREEVCYVHSKTYEHLSYYCIPVDKRPKI